MWFQAAECDAVNASLLTLIVKFNKQQLSDFLTENLPILNPFLPQKTENLRPHSSKSIENATPLPHYRHSGRENATPSSGTFPLASCKGVPPPPAGMECRPRRRDSGAICFPPTCDFPRNFNGSVRLNVIVKDKSTTIFRLYSYRPQK